MLFREIVISERNDSYYPGVPAVETRREIVNVLFARLNCTRYSPFDISFLLT